MYKSGRNGNRKIPKKQPEFETEYCIEIKIKYKARGRPKNRETKEIVCNYFVNAVAKKNKLVIIAKQRRRKGCFIHAINDFDLETFNFKDFLILY